MAAPFEIVGAPLTVYLAPVGTAFPGIDDAEGAFDPGWFKLGTSGEKNYSEDGLTVSHEQSINVFRGAGATGPRKAFRTEEDFIITFSMADVSPTQYAKVLNDAAVTTVAQAVGVSGEESFELHQGLTVTTFALLARGLSSIDDSLNAQYEVSTVFQNGNPAPVYNKGEPALLECSFQALDADATGFGTLRVQSTEPGV